MNKYGVAGTHDRDDIVERGHHVYRGRGADRRARAYAMRRCGQRREQLGTPESRAAPGSEKDADDAHGVRHCSRK
jgi:hypothetical protein